MVLQKIVHTNLEDNFLENYLEKYNNQGQLIYFKDDSKEVFYTYTDDKIIEKRTRKFNQYGVADEVISTTYEYHNLGYHITHKRIEIIDDSRTTNKLGNLVTPEEYSAEYSRVVNELLRIEEVLVTNDNISSIKIINVVSGLNTLEEYRYKNNVLIRKDFFHLIGDQQDLIKSISYQYDDKGQIIKKIRAITDDQYPTVFDYSYENFKKICVMENRVSDSESIKEETITEYDNKNRIISLREHYMENNLQYLYLDSYSESAKEELVDVCIIGYNSSGKFKLISKTHYHYH